MPFLPFQTNVGSTFNQQGFPSGQRGWSQVPMRKLRGFESHTMHFKLSTNSNYLTNIYQFLNCRQHFSKVSRVVKGVGLKHQCVSFVGSNPTPCIFRHQSIIYLLTANVNKTHFSFLKISFSIEDSNINSLHQLSWLERCAYNAKVAGSSPAWSILLLI